MTRASLWLACTWLVLGALSGCELNKNTRFVPAAKAKDQDARVTYGVDYALPFNFWIFPPIPIAWVEVGGRRYKHLVDDPPHYSKAPDGVHILLVPEYSDDFCLVNTITGKGRKLAGRSKASIFNTVAKYTVTKFDQRSLEIYDGGGSRYTIDLQQERVVSETTRWGDGKVEKKRF